MRTSTLLGVAVLAHLAFLLVETESLVEERHHRHHHDHHKKHHKKGAAPERSGAVSLNASANASAPPGIVGLHAVRVATNATSNATTAAAVLSKMKKLETEMAATEATELHQIQRGRLNVNGPLPAGFSDAFGNAVAIATGCKAGEVNIIDTQYGDAAHKLVTIYFEAPLNVVHAVEDQATEPYSKLSNGALRPFLVAPATYVVQAPYANGVISSLQPKSTHIALASTETDFDGNAASAADATAASAAGASAPGEPCAQSIDIDTDMPYGELEPFGREDTAQELTESSITESDEMVDQLERAEVAEEKRAVFRALTRLRGAAITSFDGVARSQTGNIDEYNKVHKWRMTHPLRHLADEESDISKWAFPDNADF